MIRIIPILALIVSVLHIPCSAAGASDTECRDYDEVYYEKPDEYALTSVLFLTVLYI